MAFSPTRLALLYTLVGVGWILLSDALAGVLVPPGSRFVLIGLVKGTLFVAVTGLCIYVLARREVVRGRAAQAALEVSEQRFRRQYHDFPIPTFTWRADGDDLTLVDCNAAGFEVSRGKTVVGARAAECFADDPDTADVLRRALARRSTLSVDARRTSPEGVSRIVRFRASFVPPDLVVVQTADITAEQHADELRSQLLEEERRGRERLSAVLESIQSGFFALDADWRFTYVNRHAEALFGKPRSDLLGRVLWDEIPDVHGPTFERECRRAAAERVPVAFGAHLASAWLEVHAYPSGEAISVFFDDVTDRKRTEEALRESEARFRTVFEQSAVGIALCDLHGRLLETNPALQRILGYSADELRGRLFAELTHPDDLAADLDPAEPIARGRLDDVRSEKRYIRRDHAIIWGEARISLLRDVAGEPRYLIAMLEDATQRRALEDELRQAQKMEAVGRLAGGVAHDFNNLLTGIRGYASMIAAELRIGEPLRADADEIIRAADRAAALTRQLLAFSRKQVLQPQVLDPAATVGNMGRMLRRVIGEDIELVVIAEPDVAKVRADPSQLEQVVLNLAVNARDAMARGGRLTIETRNLTVTEAEAAEYPGTEPGAYVAIRVHDTGAGIPADVLPYIFEPFFTTKDRGKGTGLGLATVYGIVSQSGGHIHADSTPGVGTSFRILLPAIRETPREETPTAPKRPSGGAETVLLVEDEPSVRSLARRVLERQGYTVLEAADGEAAIGVAAQHADRIDLLLTDVVMPRMSGRTLAGHLAELRPGLRVLFMSGYADELRGWRGAVDEGIAFLQKPFTPEDLATRVRALLDAPVADAAG